MNDHADGEGSSRESLTWALLAIALVLGRPRAIAAHERPRPILAPPSIILAAWPAERGLGVSAPVPQKGPGAASSRPRRSLEMTPGSGALSLRNIR